MKNYYFLQQNRIFKIFLVFSFCLFLSKDNLSASSSLHDLKKLKWTFEGVLGYYDRAALQRGFQVYNEVCSACHSMNLLTYRKLKDIGYSEDEVKAIAASKTVQDGPNDEGEMFERPGRPSDKFVSPYPNKKAAAAANGGAYPTDLSLIVKANPGGANYVYSVLTGYEDAPEGFEVPEGKYYNKYFAGNVISMTAPLGADGLVTYTDETNPTKDQMARDVATFLQWASEPELEARKKQGFTFMAFFVFFTIILYFLKKRVWSDVK